MQDFDVFGAEGFFFFYILLRVLRQGINSSVSLAVTIVDLEVVTRQFLSLADLFGAQILRIHELLEVVMVGKHKNFMSKAL